MDTHRGEHCVEKNSFDKMFSKKHKFKIISKCLSRCVVCFKKFINDNQTEINKELDNGNFNAFSLMYYYNKSTKNIDECVNVLKKSYEKNSNNKKYAYNLLGLYYESLGNFDQCIKYYKMAIDEGNIVSMHNLGSHYRYQKQHELANKYYMMAIDNDYPKSMHNMARYYAITLKDMDMAEKYYLLAIDREYIPSALCYANLCYKKKKYDLCKKYLMMAIDHEYSYAYIELGDYYVNYEKNYDKAEEAYLKFSRNCYRQLGNLYYLMHNHVLAKKYYILSLNSFSFVLRCTMERLLTMTTIYDIYTNIDNKTKLLDNLYKYHDKTLYDKLQNFINSVVNEMCNICYVETDCVLQNGDYVCGSCMLDHSFS